MVVNKVVKLAIKLVMKNGRQKDDHFGDDIFGQTDD